MKKTLLILFLFCSAFGSRINAQTYVDPFLASELQQKIDSFVTQHDLPGISVALLLSGDRYWNGASGEAHIYSHALMDTSHLFECASMTKMYCTAMIFRLIEQGLLHLDDTIGMYLPPMTNVPGSITITNLLMHKSGIYNFTNNPGVGNEWFNNPDSIWTPFETIENFVDTPTFQQGQFFEYSNTNFLLLGMIVEEITGTPFATELQNQVLIPYGLNQTFLPPWDSIAGPKTPGWTSFTTPGVYNTNASAILNDCSASMAFTAGALVAKPADIARFTRLLWSGQLVTDSSLNIMKQCTNVNFGGGCNGYGYGTMRYVFGGKNYYGHAGDINGFTELTIHQQEDSVTLTISVNRNNAPRGPMADELLHHLDFLMTSIVSEISQAEISVYPNPATDKIHVRFDSENENEFQVLIVSQLGSVVKNQSNNFGGNSIEVDVSDLSPGLYFVECRTNDSVVSKKILVE